MDSTKSDQPEGRAASAFAIYREGGTTPDIRLTINLVLVARRWRALLDEKLRPIGQSSARMEAMSAIMNAPDPNAQIDIAKRLRIEGPTMTRMVDTLSRDGLVAREQAPHDRRTNYVTITDAGLTALEEIFGVVDPLRDRLFEGFTPEQVVTLTDQLALLLERLDDGLPEPEGD
ncbi:MarR family winged helix-turn-helix transcriptional regulator [Croceibacterium mercuriale]|uniref:MarR family winged helix-turn-helix transcriptional regulator n=1 Tax=Croceibacterium mercuriale TaxID=1572751 RepID=UPI0013791A36|nr:MarR family transcriptional regulator [Croceibacterium mercuriale]